MELVKSRLTIPEPIGCCAHSDAASANGDGEDFSYYDPRSGALCRLASEGIGV